MVSASTLRLPSTTMLEPCAKAGTAVSNAVPIEPATIPPRTHPAKPRPRRKPTQSLIRNTPFVILYRPRRRTTEPDDSKLVQAFPRGATDFPLRGLFTLKKLLSCNGLGPGQLTGQCVMSLYVAKIISIRTKAKPKRNPSLLGTFGKRASAQAPPSRRTKGARRRAAESGKDLADRSIPRAPRSNGSAPPSPRWRPVRKPGQSGLDHRVDRQIRVPVTTPPR